jgi:three-Cys-motif partner protein
VSSNRRFFESPQAAAIYKHTVLKRYIPPFAGKLGSISPGGRVIVYDAYSGPGRYEDDQPASPQLVVDTAIEMARLRRDIYSIFSDRDAEYIARLRALMAERGVDPSTYEIHSAPVEEHIDSVLVGCGYYPLFVFLDPFGLTLPFDRIVDLLTRRDRDPGGHQIARPPKTELLMNFSYEAVRRIGGVVTSTKDYPARDAQIKTLNVALGGYWWHDLARRADDDWPREILSGFAAKVKERTGYGYIRAEVADSLEAKPVYELILFTRHDDGLWEMLVAMSYARRDWLRWLKAKAEEARQGQATLDIPTSFDDDEQAWIAEIESNARRILADRTSFVVMRTIPQLFGRTLGLAREKHLRQALRRLHRDGIIGTMPVRDLQRATV